jgi:phage terminase large subunit-like protein
MPLLPWQRVVADVAGELVDGGGRFAYPLVVVVVPRRAGKTALTLATLAHRAQLRPMARGWYTAQRREDAAKQFRDEWVPIIEGSPLSRKIRLRRSQGSEGVTFPRNGSRLQLFAPGPTALHGGNADTVVIDEAWAFDLMSGEDVEAGIRPAQATRPLRQTWIISAGGTVESTWLDAWMTRGLAAARADPGQGIAYFEWAADPTAADYDPSSPATWRTAHPALGHTLDEIALAQDYASMPLAMFERSYLNVWPRPSVSGVGLDLEAWAAAADDQAAPSDPLVFAIDVAWDRSSAAIAAAGSHESRIAIEVVEHAPGLDWVAPALRTLKRRHKRARFVADPLLSASILADLGDRFGVEALTAGEVGRSCVMFADTLASGRIAHRDQLPLTTAVSGAVRRPLGDAFAWSRKTSPVDISPLYAVTFAAYRHLSTPAPQKPMVASSR